MIDALASAEPNRQIDAISQIAATPSERLSAEALAALVRCAGAPAKSVQLRTADALAAVAGAGDERAAATLRAALADSSRRMRWGAAYALARIGGDAFGMDSADAIAEALGDSDSDIRWAAAGLLARLGWRYPDEIRARLLRLSLPGDPNTRRMALYCIRDLGCCGTDIIAAIESALADDNRFVRLAAVSVLARLEDPGDEVTRILAASIESDPDAGVRGAARTALARMEKR